MTWQRVCSGIEMASSSAVTAGYLARLIFCRRLAGSAATPALLPRGARLPRVAGARLPRVAGAADLGLQAPLT